MQVKEMIKAKIEQQEYTAKEALELGLFDPQCKWFEEWATKGPNDRVFTYTFDGLHGGLIYGEPADFETLRDFAFAADGVASIIWFELQGMFGDFLDKM